MNLDEFREQWKEELGLNQNNKINQGFLSEIRHFT